jgi:hypothetical protein
MKQGIRKAMDRKTTSKSSNEAYKIDGMLTELWIHLELNHHRIELACSRSNRIGIIGSYESIYLCNNEIHQMSLIGGFLELAISCRNTNTSHKTF